LDEDSKGVDKRVDSNATGSRTLSRGKTLYEAVRAGERRLGLTERPRECRGEPRNR
jgi:hypothetical protein